MTNPARVAKLDQERAHIDEAVDEIVDTIRDLHDQPSHEVLCALVEFLAEDDPQMVVLVAAGALLRLAQQERCLG